MPLKAVANEDIKPFDSGEVTIWVNDLATDRMEKAWLNWGLGVDPKKVSEGQQLIIQKFGGEDFWTITHAPCPVEEPNA